tara:strand:+ start:304 stop:489 length:186 start_codon:yes stop_codon:yes gene_type:complete
MKKGDRIKHNKLNKEATVIDLTWLWMRGQPMEIAKVKWDNGKIINVNSRSYRNWTVMGEEE